MLSVRNGAKAVDFYRTAFGAGELFRIDDPEGAVVARMSVGEAEFWVADESPEHQNFSPETLGGSVRMVMIVDDPDAAFDRGGGVGGCRSLAGKRSVRLAFGPSRKSLRASLGNRQAFGQRCLSFTQAA
jgi:hypothetical protein